jgi:hypothetical protein
MYVWDRYQLGVHRGYACDVIKKPGVRGSNHAPGDGTTNGPTIGMPHRAPDRKRTIGVMPVCMGCTWRGVMVDVPGGNDQDLVEGASAPP